ncbi:hypothetical protein LAWI1_G003407 [Lachnellula willkommii]|uniref:Methyltransferase domain-containing protein n=1 Tax=Lachnellula willkommii TaxID=215461 RepID=A0A559MEA5_9HELO|nr:hypothetical protein LAWI1_G003407 [Lachnellula willkommii]
MASTSPLPPRDYDNEVKKGVHTVTSEIHIPESLKHTVSLCNPSCASSRPLIKIVNLDDLIKATAIASPSPRILVTSSFDFENDNAETGSVLSMVYNEYGELVEPEDLRRPPIASELTTTGILRVFKKAYHHYFRTKIGDVIFEEMKDKILPIASDGSSLNQKHKISAWLFDPSLPTPGEDTARKSETPEPQMEPAAPCEPRVLELGCGDGNWCIQFKNQNPSWIVDGIDDTNHWQCVHKDFAFRDFMKGDGMGEQSNLIDCNAEFTVRNLNALLQHPKPIPTNHYSLIRGRDIFDRVENPFAFLDAVRLILQPGGVIEFLELDPRPRTPYDGPIKRVESVNKSSGDLGWTDKIADRFKKEVDTEIATNSPGWSGRVEARLKGNMRQRIGVAAANLKDWLEGAGFYDVAEDIIRLPIGGFTSSGQQLEELLLERIELENSIPKLAAELPAPELDQISSGAYYLNLHLITGRKPPYPRTGDLLPDGTRQEMTASTYDAMAQARSKRGASTNRWKRCSGSG